MQGRLRHLLFGLYVLVCLGALVWPGYAWFGNSIEPYVLGIPYSLAWVIGWVLLTFVALVVFHLSGGRPDRGGPSGERD